MLTSAQIAYVAGVLDARAHIEIGDRSGKAQPRLAITTRKLTLLQHMADITGTKVSVDHAGYHRRPCGDHCTVRHSEVVRQSAKWRTDSGRATVILYSCLPFMIAQRTEALTALRAGLDNWPPVRGDTWRQMEQLGWPLPTPAGSRKLTNLQT